jgi:hypothetical protein
MCPISPHLPCTKLGTTLGGPTQGVRKQLGGICLDSLFHSCFPSYRSARFNFQLGRKTQKIGCLGHWYIHGTCMPVKRPHLSTLRPSTRDRRLQQSLILCPMMGDEVVGSDPRLVGTITGAISPLQSNSGQYKLPPDILRIFSPDPQLRYSQDSLPVAQIRPSLSDGGIRSG